MIFPLNCPHCDFLLDGGDVYEAIEKKNGKEKALKWAPYYGWSKKTPRRFSKILSVYSHELDITTGYVCPDCKKEIKIDGIS